MKPDDAVLHYTAIQKEHPVPYVLYVDFETFQTSDDSGVAVHEASGFCCVRVSRVDDETFEPFLYSGPDVLTEFYRHIYAEQEAISKKLSIEKEMAPRSDAEERLYGDASVCQNCHNNFDSKSRIKTKHHCHTTGGFIGPVYASCNLQFKYRKRSRSSDDDDSEFFIPVIAHNIKGFDAHLILKGENETSRSEACKLMSYPQIQKKNYCVSDWQTTVFRQSAISERFRRQSHQYIASRRL